MLLLTAKWTRRDSAVRFLSSSSWTVVGNFPNSPSNKLIVLSMLATSSATSRG